MLKLIKITDNGGKTMDRYTAYFKGDGVVDGEQDEKSSKVRGLLCRQCNTGLGQFQDDPVRLKQAIEYLKGQ